MTAKFSEIGTASGRAQAPARLRVVAAAFVLALLTLRVFALLHYRVDSDEPQHLHIVWGWANGLLQYRDLFDNHSPLFQMLCAPLFRALGERADIIVPMRAAMVPLYFLDIWCVYKIGTRLANPLGGCIAAALTALSPTFFFVCTEFRTDDLWTALWLCAVLVAMSGSFRGQRPFWFGLLIGAAFSTSMKTTLLLASLTLAVMATLGLRVWTGEKISWRSFWKPIALAFAGALIVPAALIAFFAAQHALEPMYYCILQHNALPGLGKWGKTGFRFHRYIFPLCVLPLLGLAWLALRSHTDRGIAVRRAIMVLTAGFYLTLLRSYWPLVTPQDYVPFQPIMFLALMPALLWIGELAAPLHPALRYALPCLLLVGELVMDYRICPPRTNDVAPFNAHLADLLRLADRDDYVMDPKGETIFRKRPFYYVLEGVTNTRMKLGHIKDDVPHALVRTATNIVRPRRLREDDYDFINKNYIEVAEHVVVSGKMLGAAPFPAPVKFETLWPARYVVVAEKGTADGTIDGERLAGAHELAAGAHTAEIKSPSRGRVALVWAQAWERGFSPFRK